MIKSNDNHYETNFSKEFYPSVAIRHSDLRKLSNLELIGLLAYIKYAAKNHYLSLPDIADHFDIPLEHVSSLFHQLLDTGVITKGEKE